MYRSVDDVMNNQFCFVVCSLFEGVIPASSSGIYLFNLALIKHSPCHSHEFTHYLLPLLFISLPIGFYHSLPPSAFYHQLALPFPF